MASYEYETHEYDVVIVGAGGAAGWAGRVDTMQHLTFEGWFQASSEVEQFHILGALLWESWCYVGVILH